MGTFALINGVRELCDLEIAMPAANQYKVGLCDVMLDCAHNQ